MECIKAPSRVKFLTGMVLFTITMVINMRARLKMENQVEKEPISIQAETFMKDNGRMGKKMGEAFIVGQVETGKKARIEMDNHLERLTNTTPMEKLKSNFLKKMES